MISYCDSIGKRAIENEDSTAAKANKCIYSGTSHASCANDETSSFGWLDGIPRRPIAANGCHDADPICVVAIKGDALARALGFCGL